MGLAFMSGLISLKSVPNSVEGIVLKHPILLHKF